MKQKPSTIMSTFQNDGRMGLTGGKSTIVSFFSIRRYHKCEDNVASTSVTPVNVSVDSTDLPALATLWKLQATLKETSFPERGNASLQLRIYR